MKRALAVVLFLGSCSAWVPYPAAPRLSWDARLGVQVMEGHPLRPALLSAGATPNAAALFVHQPRGVNRDVETVGEVEGAFFLVDASGSVTRLPPSPLDGERAVSFGVAVRPGDVIASGVAQGFALYDGAAGAWTTLPMPTTGLARLEPVMLDATHVFAHTGDGYARWNGVDWLQVPATGAAHGPVDATGIRRAYLESTGVQGRFRLCTVLLAWETLQPFGVPSCLDDVVDENGSAFAGVAFVNGTTSAFQLLVGTQLFVFESGSFRRGASVPAGTTLVSQPGQATVPLRFGVLASLVPAQWLVRGGEVVGTQWPQMAVQLSCECDRNVDASCDCVPGEPTAGVVGAFDGATAWVVGTRTVDARLVVFARPLALPLQDSPFGRVCALDCTSEERCELNERLEPVCVAKSPMGTVSQAKLTATVVLANVDATRPTVRLTKPDGSPTSARVTSPPPALVIEGPALEPLRVVLEHPTHASRTLDVALPNLTRTADLGAVPLVLGHAVMTVENPTTWVGSEGWAEPVNAAGALLMPRVEADGGASWVALRSLDAGVVLEALGPARFVSARQLLRPFWRPEVQRVFLPTPAGVLAFDDVTLAPRGSLSGADFTDARGAWAGARGGLVALPRDTSTTVARVEASSLVAWQTLPFRAVEGAISGDGGVVLAKGTSWSALLDDGSLTAVPGLPPQNVVLEGSGRAAFFIRTTTTSTELVEVLLPGGVSRTVETGKNQLAAGLTSDRLVASGGFTTDAGLFETTVDVYASGVKVGALDGGGTPWANLPGAWAMTSSTQAELYGIDDGARVDVVPGGWQPFAFASGELGLLGPMTTGFGDVRVYRDGALVKTFAQHPSAVFGAGDGRAAVGPTVVRYDAATGARTQPQRLADPSVAVEVDPLFADPPPVTAFSPPRRSARGLPCLLYRTPHLEWTVAPSGVVTRDATRTDFFCAP